MVGYSLYDLLDEEGQEEWDYWVNLRILRFIWSQLPINHPLLEYEDRQVQDSQSA
ncbi:MAG: hypothetical protein GY861_03795 [bacterium]|nr:hypothetical protein [bacterium]